VYLRRIQLSNFRNFRREGVEFPPGVTIIAGRNGAGKTSLLEAAQFVCSGRSFRTSREREMVLDGYPLLRVKAEVDWENITLGRAAAFEPEAGVKVDAGGGPMWLPAGAVLCFSPDDLQLIKGPPAIRRRFLDEAITRRRPSYNGTLLEYRKVLAQRNSFLRRARAGLTRLADISPWDRQLAALAVKIHAARHEHCLSLTPHFEAAFNEITGSTTRANIHHVSQLDEMGAAGAARAAGDRDESEMIEEALVAVLAEKWSEDMERSATGTGTHRDDAEFNIAGRSLKPYGSQGEQRAAVLALLLADRRLGLEAGEAPLLLLDDVMSELDPDRRRLLLAALSPGASAPMSQTIITAADTGLFTEGELAGACLIEVEDGAIRAAKEEAGV